VLAKVKEIITSGTFQQKESDTQRCKAINQAIDAVISVVIAAASAVIGGELGATWSAGKEIADISKAFIAIEKGTVFKGSGVLFKAIQYGIGIEQDIFGRLVSHFASPGMKHGSIKSKWLTTGVSTNPYCTTFSGDYPDLNEQNIDALKKVVNDFFEDTLDKFANEYFETMYNGAGPDENGQTMTSFMMKSRKWTGRDSVIETLNQAVDKRHGYVPLCWLVSLYSL
jgi:hypothetical protein